MFVLISPPLRSLLLALESVLWLIFSVEFFDQLDVLHAFCSHPSLFVNVPPSISSEREPQICRSATTTVETTISTEFNDKADDDEEEFEFNTPNPDSTRHSGDVETASARLSDAS